MAASLLVRLQKAAHFSDVLEAASRLLVQLLNLDPKLNFIYELPPARKHLQLDGKTLIDVNFPGAYIQLEGIDRSLVNFHAFNSPIPGNTDRLLLACGASGRGPASEVLTAALAAAAGSLTNGSNDVIDDGEHHWLDKDEYGPEELIKALRLSDESQDFNAAVERVYRREAIHERHPAR